MFKFDIHFCGQVPPQKDYTEMTLDQIYEYIHWDATITIELNNQLFFSAEIAIIEFYWYLTNWVKVDPFSNKDPFVYSTIEHTKPVLTFFAKDNGCWEIDSIWKKKDRPILVEERMFFAEVYRLVDKLASYVQKKTGGGLLS